MMSQAARDTRACRTWPALVLLLLASVVVAGWGQRVGAHWIPPEQIISMLREDPSLRTRAGVRSVERQERLLVIRVDPRIWAALPREQRRALAADWHRLWRHNVDQGIVAVVAADNDKPLVNYDGFGQVRLLDGTPTAEGL